MLGVGLMEPDNRSPTLHIYDMALQPGMARCRGKARARVRARVMNMIQNRVMNEGLVSVPS